MVLKPDRKSETTLRACQIYSGNIEMAEGNEINAWWLGFGLPSTQREWKLEARFERAKLGFPPRCRCKSKRQKKINTLHRVKDQK